MKSYLEMALALLLVCAAPSLAQYIGSGRPWAATRSVADSTRLDSVAAAGEAEDTLLHARIDSVRDNTGGGGSGAPALDTLFYDYILGFTVADSLRAGGYSKFIRLGGTQADTSDADTLIWCIDQLKASGGDIYICGTPADTIWWYYAGTSYDSLPTAGGIDGIVTVDGDGMDKVIHAHIANTNIPFEWTVDRHAGVGSGSLIWRNQQFYNLIGSNYQATRVRSGRVEIYDSRVINSWYYHQQDAAVTTHDSVNLYQRVVFGSAAMTTEGGHQAGAGAYINVTDCTGFYEAADNRHTSLNITACVFAKVKLIQSNNGVQTNIVGNRMNFISTGTEGIQLGSTKAHIQGNVFIAPADGSVPYMISGTSGEASITGNSLYDGGLNVGRSSGNYIYSAATGWLNPTASGYSMGNVYSFCTTAININGGINAVVHGNVYRVCTTDLSGTPVTNTDNSSF